MLEEDQINQDQTDQESISSETAQKLEANEDMDWLLEHLANSSEIDNDMDWLLELLTNNSEHNESPGKCNIYN
jgi:hypothetical protein